MGNLDGQVHEKDLGKKGSERKSISTVCYSKTQKEDRTGVKQELNGSGWST